MPANKKQKIIRVSSAIVAAVFVATILVQLFPQSPLHSPDAYAASHQFSPTGGSLVTGTQPNVTTDSPASTEGTNVGSWKGTLANDDFHWQVTSTTSGYDANLTMGGFALNGANTIFLQTEFDLDGTVPQTVVQICDWVSSTSVDNSSDAACTTGGWRTLNARKVAVTTASPTSYTWQIYNGYWSDGSNTSVNTPLTNFVSGSNQLKVRYYSTTNTTSTVSIDYVRAQAVINPVYGVADFTDQGGGSVTGDYMNTNALHQTPSDDQRIQFAGTGSSAPDGYFTFKNVETYTGMNTFSVRMETSCSAATADLRYTMRVYNYNTTSWEDMSSAIDCATTDATNVVAKNNVTLANYISSGSEMLIRFEGSANSTTAIRVDMMYLQLGSTNSDTNSCEVSFGTEKSGRVTSNPSTLLDSISAMDADTDYIYSGGYDTVGGDKRWRIEKRDKDDGTLVGAFGTDGAVTSDPSSSADEVTSIRVDGDYVYVAGYDTNPGNEQWRIEKRDKDDGSLVTAFDTDGIWTSNPSGSSDRITDIDIDGGAIYAFGTRNTISAWRYEKLDITDGSYETGFETDGILESAPASTQMSAASIRVDGSYIYTIGTQANNLGQISSRQARVEKRDITDGSLIVAFDTDGVFNSNLAGSGDDTGVDIAVDSSYVYILTFTTSGNPQWNIEKLDITDASLETAFDTDGRQQVNPSSGFGELSTSIAIDSGYVYATGIAEAPNTRWDVAKIDISTGAKASGFSGEVGATKSVYLSSSQSNAVLVDSSYVYVGGYTSDSVDSSWMIEKRDISTGTLVASGFGGDDCSSTRTIDTTSGADTWRVMAEDESSNQGHDFYPHDTDVDPTAEETAAANVSFSVTQPTNARPTGVFYAGMFNGGTTSATQLGIKDYSGINNVTGGWTGIGALTGTSYAATYIDTITQAQPAGIQTNPAYYIDTANNAMNLRIRTGTANATATNDNVHDVDFLMVSMQWVETEVAPSKSHVFMPTGSELVMGTAQNVTAVALANSEGVNTGSWKGTRANDDFHWTFASTASGMNAQLSFDDVLLNNANAMMVYTEFDQDATVPNAVVQICDWASSSNVDNAADSQCTTGGWRTLNNRKAGTTATAATTYSWQVYDGYWNDGTNSSVSTPLTNFLDGSNTVKLRYYSTTNTTSTFAIDYALVLPITNSVYMPAGFTNMGSGSTTNTYSNVNNYFGGNAGSGSTAQFPSDDNRMGVAGTAGTVADGYFSFKNIKTMEGMNTIMVRAEHRCSTTGISYRPKIYNYFAGSWEDLTSASISCSTTDATSMFAKNSINIDHYLNNGEASIGWYGLANSTLSIEIDRIYIMVGMTNADTNDCEISIGSLSSGSCADTRTLDTANSAAAWNVLAEDTSSNQGHDYYPFDTDADGVGLEETKASHVKFAMPELTSGPLVGFNWSARFMSTTAGTIALGVRDYGGSFSGQGGWLPIGLTATTSFVYTDPLNTSASAPDPFFTSNMEELRDAYTGQMWLRLRTFADNPYTNQSVSEWDFAMIAPMWIETKTQTTPRSSEQLRHGKSFQNGVEQPIQL